MRISISLTGPTLLTPGIDLVKSKTDASTLHSGFQLMHKLRLVYLELTGSTYSSLKHLHMLIPASS